MSWRVALLASLFVATTWIASARSQPVGVGEKAPDFTLRDHNGKPLTLSDQRGKKVILVFYRGHW